MSKSGPALTTVYTAGGEVLMGTLRWEKEADEISRESRRLSEYEQKREELRFSEAKIGAQIKALEMELEKQRVELGAYAQNNNARRVSVKEREKGLRSQRENPTDHPSAESEKEKKK